jgi:acetoin utilization protein AcuB
MTKRTLRVGDYMTESPHTVGAEQTLAAAHDLMRKHQVRHLPVLHAGKLVGLLSQRDLHLVETLPDVEPSQVLVEEAMSGDPYVVSPDADLAVVADEMAEQKLGSAVVMQGAQVVGVLTTVDALRALADALR